MAREDLSYYEFNPSKPAAIVACVLFSIILILSFIQTIRYRAWIWFIMVFAVAMEAVGYGFRIASVGDVTARVIYIVQFCLTILAPVFMAGIIYVVFGRIVFHVVPAEARTTRLLWVPPRWLTPIFVGFDILALLLQLIGAVLISGTQATDKNAADKLKLGKDIALVGVTLQIVAFGLFSIIAARFHFTSRRFKSELERRYVAAPGDKFVTLEGDGRKFKPKWRGLLYAVNISCILILIRSVYREVEFGGGKNGYTQKHEWFLYVFDTLPMFFVTAVYTLFPPGAYVTMGWRQRNADVDARRLPSSYTSDAEAYPMRTQGHA